MAWMLVATGMLAQIGEDRVAHTRLSKIYVDGNAQGMFFQIMYRFTMLMFWRFTLNTPLPI